MSASVVLLFVLGLVLIVLGAEWLVDGASSIARKTGVSEFVIGLTIVGFGTSCPELVVSLTGAIEGNADISIGNVIGSNIFNTLLILGLTSLISPIAISKSNKRRDIPVVMLFTLTFILFGLYNQDISRQEGVIFLLLFAAYIVYCFKSDSVTSDEGAVKQMSVSKAILLTLLGLGSLIVGGRLFVDNSVLIASSLGVSDKVIAITLLAGGTSLPELVTCIVAGLKHKNQLALGNILGSNVFNILLILGCSALVTPLSFASITWIDLAVLFGSALLIFIFAFTGKRPAASTSPGPKLSLSIGSDPAPSNSSTSDGPQPALPGSSISDGPQPALPGSNISGQLDRWEGGILTALWLDYIIWLLVA